MKHILPFAIVAIALAVIAACATAPIPTSPAESPARATNTKPGPSPTATPTKPKVLRIAIGTRPDVLEPQKAATTGEIAVLQMAYEGLTRVDEKGRVLPGAADKWEFGSDGKTLTFHLRDRLKRADGTPLTANDFEFAFKRALDPRIGGANPSFLDDVRGATAAYSLDPKSKPEDIQKALDNVGIRASDDTTLVVSFNQPTGFWLTIASTWISYPSDRSKIEQDPDAWWLKPENHNGNGPFKISEIQEQVIKFVPNPNYWGGKPKLDRVEFYWVSDSAEALQRYRDGTLDIVRVTSDDLAPVQADPTLSQDLARSPAAWVTYLGFNVKKPPFSDKYVRLAFSRALDREAIAREVLKGLGKPYLSWIPPGVPGYDETATVPSFDANVAVQTLIDGGYGTADKKKVDCNKLGTVKLSYSNTPRNQALFQSIAGSLTRVFACPVLLDPVEPGTYAIMARDPKTAPQIFLLTWLQEYPHPQNWLFLHTCVGVYAARIGYCNKEFDAAFAAANQELDWDKMLEKYKAAQKILVGDVATAFLWNTENAFLIKPYVLGAREHYSTSDSAWPGQFGTVLTYDIDTAKVGAGYPRQ